VRKNTFPPGREKIECVLGKRTVERGLPVSAPGSYMSNPWLPEKTRRKGRLTQFPNKESSPFVDVWGSLQDGSPKGGRDVTIRSEEEKKKKAISPSGDRGGKKEPCQPIKKEGGSPSTRSTKKRRTGATPSGAGGRFLCRGRSLPPALENGEGGFC